MIEVILWFWIMLSPPEVHGRRLPLTWWWTLRASGACYQVDPYLTAALCRIESGWRTGLLGGKWYGPGNIHRDYRRRWPVQEPLVNLWIASRALRGPDLRQTLQRYNTDRGEKWQSYYRAVTRLHAQFLRQASIPRKTTAKWRAGWRSWARKHSGRVPDQGPAVYFGGGR